MLQDLQGEQPGEEVEHGEGDAPHEKHAESVRRVGFQNLGNGTVQGAKSEQAACGKTNPWCDLGNGVEQVEEIKWPAGICGDDEALGVGVSVVKGGGDLFDDLRTDEYHGESGSQFRAGITNDKIRGQNLVRKLRSPAGQIVAAGNFARNAQGDGRQEVKKEDKEKTPPGSRDSFPGARRGENQQQSLYHCPKS